MDRNDAYDQFATKNTMPLFFQAWYLNALVGEKNWACEFVENKEKVVAIWLYFPKKKYGIPYCVIPTMVKYLGPLFDVDVNPNDRLDIAQKLFQKLPPHYSFSQQYLPSYSTDFCRKITAGFVFNKQTSFKERNTFYWDVSKSDEELLAGMDGNYRRAINKFGSSLELRGFRPNDNNQEIAGFIDLLESSMGKLANHGLSNEGLADFIISTERHGQGKLLLLFQDTELISGSFIVWDSNTAYYLLAGNNTKAKKIYPGVQMAFHSAKYLRQNTGIKNLDFVGSDIESIARIWRKLGAERQIYSLFSAKSWWFFK